MRRKNTEKISDVLGRFLKQNQLDEKIYEKRVIDSWSLVMGDSVSEFTKSLFFKNHVLYIKISSAVLRNELFMMREQIKNSLNKHVQSNIIKEIKFQ